jgi:G3E family GTPase
MKIIIFGGFLGSGKTTVIRRLIKGLVAAGRTCAIIENEIGQEGIDDALLREAKVEITPLFGGCVCCQISGSLIEAVARIQEQVSPDYIIVEMTGLAMIDGIRDLFEKYGRPDVEIRTVCVVDMARWKYLVTALAHIFDHQVAGSDVVLLNKVDVAAPTDRTFETLREKAPLARIVVLDEAMSDPGALWAKLAECAAL